MAGAREARSRNMGFAFVRRPYQKDQSKTKQLIISSVTLTKRWRIHKRIRKELTNELTKRIQEITSKRSHKQNDKQTLKQQEKVKNIPA